MSDIFTGNGLSVQYNPDTGNRSPQGVDNVVITEINTFPTLSIKSETNNFETYDNNYKTVLLSDKAVDPFQIVVNYLPDDSTHQFLDEMAETQTDFQIIIQYQLNMDTSTITFAIVNGYITSTQLSGDKDSVVTKSYTFTPNDVIARSMTANALLPIYQGDYGIGSNTTDVPQYEPEVPTGNSFIKIPAAQAGNPAGSDMMGIGLVDGTNVAEFAMTKTGTLSLYAKNNTTAWTRIYTATQMDVRYVPLTRTVNGHALTGNVTVTKGDVGLGTVSDDPQLTIANNLSDLANKTTARSNLGVYSTGQVDTRIDNLNTALSTDIDSLDTKINDVNTTLNAEIDNLTSNLGTNYVPKTTTINGHDLSTNVTITKGDIGLGNVTNDQQLKVSANLSDVANMDITRANLGVNIITHDNGYSFLNSPSFTNRLIAGDNGDWGLQNSSNGSRIPLSIDNGGTGATSKDQARINLGVQNIINDGSSQTTITSPNGQTLLVVPNSSGNWGVLRWNGTGYENTPLGVGGGGTGATNAANARINLQLDRVNQASGETMIYSPDKQAYLTVRTGGEWGVYDINTGYKPLGIAQGGTGATSVGSARTNFGLGSEQAVVFANITSSVNGQPNGGIISSNRNNSLGTQISYSRIYNEYQNNVAKTTFHTSNVSASKNAYLQYDQDANLTGINTISTSGTATVGSVVANGWINAKQGNRVGVTTETGGSKDLFLQNITGDGSTGGWVNLLQGNWYNGYWQIGAVRGNGTDIDMVQLGINNQGSDWKSFQFRNSYGGYISSPRGYKGQAFAAGWITPSQYMGATFFADRVAGNDNGYVPIVSGASSSTGGYSTTGSFGIISGGSANWPSMALSMVGDGTYIRGYTFDMGGNISTFDSPGGIFGGSFIFQRAATSDRTLKYDIVYTDGKESFDRVQQWLPTMFKYNGQDTQRYGLIAQDLQAIDPQYVKTVKGGPILEEVEETDEETGDTKTVNRETGEYSPDTLALDNNVLLTDLACAFKYACDKHHQELDELKALVQSLLDNK
ncbi:tail fiber domain-containing protein [Enterobacter bugandensis]|nr:tail fiber domain-containing protein [Enterobacter bugandensis]